MTTREDLADILEPGDELIELPQLPHEEHIGGETPGDISIVSGAKRVIIQNGCLLCWQHAWMGEHAMHRTVAYIAWGGKHGELPVTHDLGPTARPISGKHWGPRRLLWDLAYGYVNGFPPTAILYYILTRSLSRTIYDRIRVWETRRRA